MLGRWRGGNIVAGAGYLLQFDPDGTYRQTFITNNQRDFPTAITEVRITYPAVLPDPAT